MVGMTSQKVVTPHQVVGGGRGVIEGRDVTAGSVW